jgi:hypothetical protein
LPVRKDDKSGETLAKIAKIAKIAKEDKQSPGLSKPIYFSGFSGFAILARIFFSFLPTAALRLLAAPL